MSNPITREEMMKQLERVDDILIESMDKSYEMVRQATLLKAKQNLMMIHQIGLGLLMNFPEAHILRINVKEGNFIADSLVDNEGSVILEGDELRNFVILENSSTVELNLRLMGTHEDMDWIYSVTAEPEEFSAPYSPIYLEHLDDTTLAVDVPKAAQFMDIS